MSMQQVSAILLEQRRFGAWASIVLRCPALMSAKPGQYIALRCSIPGSHDPLIRQPAFVVSTDATTSTCNLLLDRHHPALQFLANSATGTTVDVLGPLGKGWQVEESTRTVALVGTASDAAPLFALAHHAVARGLAVSVLLGAISRDDAPPPFLLPPAAEYNVAQSKVVSSAAIALLDDQTIRWADMLAVALPYEYWGKVAQRVSDVRIRWSRGFAQVAVLPDMACCVGVCGVCEVETQQAQRLACSDGPVFDLRDLVR